LEQDLAAARRDVETKTALAEKASAEAAQSKQTTASDGSDLQKSLKQERARADRLEQDLAAARRDAETKTALVIKASAAAARAKQAAESSAGDLQKSLQQEHARADRLGQDLAAARRDAETQTSLVAKASAEAARVKQASESSAGDLQKSLQQERARADQLEQDLAAARREVEAQTALVTKAGAEAAQAKQAAETGAGELQKALKQEHARADQLEQDLAAARREVETKTALTAKASDEAARVKQAAENGAGELQKSLQQEHARAGQLERDLAAARRDVETMSVLVIKVSAAAARAKQAAESSAGDLQKSVQQEHARAGRLEQDLAAARRDVETKSVLMMKASAAAARARRAAENSSGDMQKSLQQERDRADGLAQDLAAARRDVETKTELAIKAGEAAARAKQAAESDAGDLQTSLQQEHARADRLEQDLATARREVETKTALATKASDEAVREKQAAQGSAGDLQKSLQQERERADRLEQDLAAARREVEARTELVIKASAVAARAKQEAENGAGDLQKSLQQEHARADQLEQDLAAARRDAESKTALAAKASDEADRVKQAAQRIVGELQKSLQQERDQRERLERNLASADHAKDAPVPPEAVTVGHTTQDKPSDTVAKPND
jgi:septal ring factor EnvC (AmiA/AmiB activator)